jgi:glycosyltransferase involved in cell wall biosynthesis
LARIRIGMISGYDPLNPTRGGAEISFYILAKFLASLGAEIHIITRPSYDNQRRTEVVNGIFVHRVLSGLSKLTFADGGIASVMLSSNTIKKEICDIHKNEHFDLIHSCNRNSAVGTVLAARTLGIPSVLHIRDYWPFCPTTSLQRYSSDPKCGSFSTHCIDCHFQDYRETYGSRALPWAFYAYLQTKVRKSYAKDGSQLIAISEFVKKVLIKNGFDEHKISVVPNPIEFVEKPQIMHDGNGKKILIFSGDLTIHKGLFDVINAVKIIQAINHTKTNIELRLFGKESPGTNLNNYFKANNFIKIMGRVPHKKMLAEFAKGDVVVLPFRRPEAFGRVVVEAMYAGVPVVSYATGGVSEIIKNEQTGFLVEPGNIKMLAKTILRLLEDEALRKSTAEKASESVKNGYDPTHIAKKMMVIYENLTKHRTNC